MTHVATSVSDDRLTAASPLSDDLLRRIDAYWRAANYVSVGQIYLMDNPLLREPLKVEHTKPRLLGHWGTTPGLNFIYAHLNRVIVERDLDVIYICGPGHGGPGMVANAYLEGTYTELYSAVTQDEEGLRRLFKQFSFPGGIPSHAAPETPGSIHEGGELGYSLAHAYGAAFDNPNLLVTCVIGDGEAETGPLATSWHSNKFLNPATDGAVLPILHLNGYKIANPTILARIPRQELEHLLEGYGYQPYFVEGDDPPEVHQLMASTLDRVLDEIASIQRQARQLGQRTERPHWPVIVMRTPKGWTGPKEVDGLPTEGTWRSHQVPLAELATDRSHLAVLEEVDGRLAPVFRRQVDADYAGSDDIEPVGLVALLEEHVVRLQRHLAGNIHNQIHSHAEFTLCPLPSAIQCRKLFIERDAAHLIDGIGGVGRFGVFDILRRLSA